MQNVNKLPAKVRGELRAVLKSEEAGVPSKVVTLAPSSSVNEESPARVKRLPVT